MAKSWLKLSCASPGSAVSMTTVASAKHLLKYWPTAKVLYRGLYYAYLKDEEKEACVTRKYLAGSHQ